MIFNTSYHPGPGNKTAPSPVLFPENKTSIISSVNKNNHKSIKNELNNKRMISTINTEHSHVSNGSVPKGLYAP